ncbi:hypothetical protein Tsubulata_048493 [Turnera subulata]|uniref:Uncharacterized protein n=1 Tax=Turnera subulata TaxID=218843 RepID=A0A9Q0FQP7_9ROSI|nr:hypothetical protein Tsubulata_048493 [Turnera subulata]
MLFTNKILGRRHFLLLGCYCMIPFLMLKRRSGFWVVTVVGVGRPELIPGAHVDVMAEVGTSKGKVSEESLDKGASRWFPAQVIRLADVPLSASALQSLVKTFSGTLDHGWVVGWSLASHDNGPQTFVDAVQTQTEHGSKSFLEAQRNLAEGEYGYPSHIGKSTTRIAILGVSMYVKDVPNVAISTLSTTGDLLLAVGSPFGILSPVHFFNSMSAGSIANRYPPTSSNISLVIAGIHCLPGTEGCTVCGEFAHFIGLLIRPLRQKSSGAEIQLVIPWEAIATACCDLLLKEPQNAVDLWMLPCCSLSIFRSAVPYQSRFCMPIFGIKDACYWAWIIWAKRCNARHGGGTFIPHLNFSIPCAVLAPIFQFAKDMRDISLLQNLDQPNEHLSSIWALMPQLSPKPHPSFPNLPQPLLEDNDKQGKGSRFAKFLADRDKVLRSTPLGVAESVSNKNLYSKL